MQLGKAKFAAMPGDHVHVILGSGAEAVGVAGDQLKAGDAVVFGPGSGRVYALEQAPKPLTQRQKMLAEADRAYSEHVRSLGVELGEAEKRHAECHNKAKELRQRHREAKKLLADIRRMK